MSGKIILTGDGSHSIEMENGVTYHSIHGAIQESRHVFIREGLYHRLGRQVAQPAAQPIVRSIAQVVGPAVPETLRVFEMGMGTGLNVLLTLLEADRLRLPISYETVELYPVEHDLIPLFNYCAQLEVPVYQPLFEKIHMTDPGEPIRLSPYFTLYKVQHDMLDYSLRAEAGLVYYDAFAPLVQPELWSKGVFERLFRRLSPGAVLTTYCAKGEVRRSLAVAGFRVEKVPGPPGKREMTRGVKEER